MRTWKELNDEDCIPMEEMTKKKSICTSRSFPGMVTDFDTLRTSISNFAALNCTRRIFRQGYHYKRAGVVVYDICPMTALQTNFIDYDAERHEKLKRLDETIDKVNRLYGSETVVLGSQQYAKTRKNGTGKTKVEAELFKDSIRHDFRSPCYTTRWSDIPEAE
jgi:DNA polymerase V